MFMYHIALCTSCIALFNCDHLLHIWVDHGETKTKNQVEQVQWVFRDPQTSSYKDTDIASDQGKPQCILPKFLSFIFDTLFIILYACALSL
jgi:hypothetical protein